MSDPMDLSARAVSAAVLSGALAPMAVAEAALARIAERDPALGAFTDVDADALRADAAALSRRLAAGERPPLAGAPLAVKDNIWIEGRRITQGSRLFADHRPDRDAVAVARARAAGALIVGVAACSEFACKGVTTTPLHGPTRHPEDPALTPGGSSGGPATALGAGMAALALGTDAGGSGRRPAAHCGLVGFKPSLGAIPYGPGFAEPCWNVSVISPMARDVGDAAALFEALAGFDPRDPCSAVALRGAGDPGRLRIAWAPTLGLEAAVDADVAERTAAAVETLKAAGFEVAEAAPRWPEAADAGLVLDIQHAGLAALHGARWRATPDVFDPDLAAQIERGLGLSGAAVARAFEAGQAIRDALAEFHLAFDLLLCPTTPCPAWPLERLGPAMIGGRPAGPRDHAVFTAQFNHGMGPAISIPCGRGASGLPLGLQVAAAVGRDREVLGAALAFERALAPASEALA
ncbi:amidase [Rubrimonas cliftonensis]|uniref:Aspartyl-tRNA(Asn)/glutamyl-tRNA(Gln) amidotransferase subunit A n=1 Tax=Rubrimonas cliftonensis TaxID=89524 RepID=A0A1H4G0F8_9RHOB|nr:amidase [Rubrimonas cliftonensis]SEB02550.1 aspartyl-tRNA(Asn)/glutamyl-tRNA(Gln) amidotransferase subunit A [Rubrimonas cliftonensis]